MKRVIDLILALILLVILAIPMILVAFVIKSVSKGPVLYWSNRIGKDGVEFKMPKFRTMHVDTPALPSHLMANPDDYLFSFGSFLRQYSLDEFPQLFSILKGEMSFVGPRPALNTQDDLIALRVDNGLGVLVPGLTGWAQINGRDNLTIEEKVVLDRNYMDSQSLLFDFKILWKTFTKVIKRDGVSH